MKIRSGVIGLGRIGSKWDEGVLSDPPRTHIGALLQNNRFRLCAVSETNSANRTKFMEEWKLKIPVYESVAEMLKEERLDVITVAVPASEHYSVLKDVVKSRPKVVYCEKPFCNSALEAKEISDLARDLNVIIMVNYHRRWDEKIKNLKAKIDGISSVPRHVSVFYRKGLLNYGSHIVNLLLFYFGSIESVISETIPAVSDQFADPSISSILNFKSGLRVTMKGLDDVNYELFDVDIYYPDIKFHIEMGGYIVDMYKAVSDVYFKDYINLKVIEGCFSKGEVCGMMAAYKEIEEFIMNSKPCNTNNAYSALQTLQVLDAIRSSAINQHIVNI
jgi:predicted dehydrogenase